MLCHGRNHRPHRPQVSTVDRRPSQPPASVAASRSARAGSRLWRCSKLPVDTTYLQVCWWLHDPPHGARHIGARGDAAHTQCVRQTCRDRHAPVRVQQNGPQNDKETEVKYIATATLSVRLNVCILPRQSPQTARVAAAATIRSVYRVHAQAAMSREAYRD